MEEYISHVDFKKMMENLKNGTPKKMLKENTVGQHFNLDVTSKRGDGSVQKYQLKNVKLVNANERVFEKPDGTTVVLSPSDTYSSTKVEEGNAFTAGLAKAKKGQEFKIGDKEVKDTSNYDASMEEASYTDNYEGSWGYREGKVKESHEGNDQWYDAFSDTLAQLNISDKARKLVDRALNHADVTTTYSDMTPQDAAKEFVKDIVATFKNQVKEGESFDFNKSAIESAAGDKISHTETDDYGRPIYFSTKDTNVNYYIGDNDQIIKYDSETGERFPIGDLKSYDEPAHDYEPDTDADYEEPRDDFDMTGGDFNDGEFWENEVKKLQEIAGIRSQDDGPEDDDDEARKKRAKKAEMDDEEAENAERDEVDEANRNVPLTINGKVVRTYTQNGDKSYNVKYDDGNMNDEEAETETIMVSDDGWDDINTLHKNATGLDEEAHADGSHMRDPDTAAKTVAEKHGAELKPLYDKYRAAYEPYIKDINNKELSKEYSVLVKEFQNNAINWCGHEMLEAGMKRVQVNNLLSGYGYFEDWLSDYITAIGKELKGVSEGVNEIGGHGDAPDNPKLQAAAKYLVQNRDRFLTQDYFFPHAISTLSLKSDKDLYDYVVNNWHSDGVYDTVAHMKSQIEKDMYANTDPNIADPINEGAGYEDPYTLAKAVAQAHPELQRFALEDRKMFHKAAFKYANEMMTADGISRVAIGNLISGAADEDWPSDYISALGKELEGMEEGLNMPPLQATGQTIVTNEDQAPYSFEALSPDERKQLKEYIDSYKTIKREIANLLEKAGKSGKIIEGTREEDEEVPAERRARYNEPTKTPKHNPSNLGGNRTGLVMTKAEMYEGEENGTIADSLGEKLHSTFSKVTDMAIKQLVADGWDEDQAISFLQAEIEKKGKEATMSQYDI